MRLAHLAKLATTTGSLALLMAGCGGAPDTTGSATFAASTEACAADCVQSCGELENDDSVCVGLCSAACTQLLVKAEEQIQCEGGEDCGELKAQRKTQIQLKEMNQVLTCTAKCVQTRDETTEQVREELCSSEDGECTREEIASMTQDRLNECAVGCMLQDRTEGEGGTGDGEAAGDGAEGEANAAGAGQAPSDGAKGGASGEDATRGSSSGSGPSAS
jgi:hypothetical protein